MRSLVVVVIGPWFEVGISLLRVGPVFYACPLAQGCLDEAFGLSVGSRRVGSCATVLDSHLLAGLAELT